MDYRECIIKNWETDILGCAQEILQLKAIGYPSWTVKYYDSYGVAIPYDGVEEINEHFSNSQIKSDTISIENGEKRRAIILTADYSVSNEAFATLSEALVMPGENGKNRNAILNSPVEWWKEWKSLLGNKSIDEMVYDTLGELCVFKYYVESGNDIEWDGPNGSTYDLELKDSFCEVKSTVVKDKKQVTINSQLQLDPPGKNLKLVLCQFEPSIFNGISIDDIVSDLVTLGISEEYLNSRLAKKRLEEGMSARKIKFILHDMLKYHIDENFPRITPSSFVNGTMPMGIVKITYTVDLDGLEANSLIRGTENEV